MKILNNIKEMQTLTLAYIQEDKRIGFVPTMGYLHEGHLSLVQKAKLENDIVICSIFVNPIQFGPNEDLERYPRDFERDKQLLLNAGVDILFYPSVEAMYPNRPSIQFNITDRVNILCGEKRPGHFDGVITVLMKLFHIIRPNRVYMGMKDAQQVAVVDLMIQEFNFPIELVPCDTVREEDGLAKSSRNIYLSIDERKEAPYIYKSLLSARELILAGEKSEKIIKEKVSSILSKLSGEIDYIDILSFPALKPIEEIKGQIIIAIAYKFQSARLIDNLIITI